MYKLNNTSAVFFFWLKVLRFDCYLWYDIASLDHYFDNIVWTLTVTSCGHLRYLLWEILRYVYTLCLDDWLSTSINSFHIIVLLCEWYTMYYAQFSTVDLYRSRWPYFGFSYLNVTIKTFFKQMLYVTMYSNWSIYNQISARS